MAYPVAKEIVPGIGAVLHMGKAVFLQKIQHLLPCHRQHGTNDPSANRLNSSQALQTGTPDQPHQHRLRVVIGCMGGGDFSGYPSEEEILLPRNTKFRVVGFEEGKGSLRNHSLIPVLEVIN
jgi:hypothetical protein